MVRHCCQAVLILTSLVPSIHNLHDELAETENTETNISNVTSKNVNLKTKLQSTSVAL